MMIRTGMEISAKRVVFMMAGLLAGAMSVFATTPKTSCDDLRRMELLRQSGLVIIDVRPPDDFAKGHIQDAINIPASNIASVNLPHDDRIAVYCSEPLCPLSAQVAQTLGGLGYSDVSVLDGGFAAWIAKGYPIVTSVNASAPIPKRHRLSAADLQKRAVAGNILVIDVRPPLEFSAGHISGAKNFVLETLDSAVSQLPKNIEILVYDRLTTRMDQAADKLTALGFSVSELSGGLAGWLKIKGLLEVK